MYPNVRALGCKTFLPLLRNFSPGKKHHVKSQEFCKSKLFLIGEVRTFGYIA